MEQRNIDMLHEHELKIALLAEKEKNNHKNINLIRDWLASLQGKIENIMVRAEIVVERSNELHRKYEKHVEESDEYRKKIDSNTEVCNGIKESKKTVWDSMLRAVGSYIPVAISIYLLWFVKSGVK